MLVCSIFALPLEDQSSDPAHQSPQSLRQHHPEEQKETEQEPNAHQRQKTIWIGKELVDVESEINCCDCQEQKSRPNAKQENEGAEKKRAFGLWGTQVL